MSEFAETLVGSAPEGWTAGYVTVTLRNPDRRLPVEAWRRGAFAIHEVLSPTGGFRLSHAPTGLCIWSFEALEDAVELAEKIEPLADWNSFKKMLPPGTELYPKVRRVIDEIDGRSEPRP
jgi:hypothetical protein